MNANTTVAITSFRRPEFLRRAVLSAKLADCPVVCYAAGLTRPMVEVLEWADRVHGVTWDGTSDDPGNNEAWKRAASMVKTRYMILLHDDDELIAPIGEALRNYELAMDEGYGWVMWNARISDGRTSWDWCNGPEAAGRQQAVNVRNYLMEQERSISPGAALWRTEDVQRTFWEAGMRLRDPVFFTRKTMMVGNDLLLWLRAAERYAWYWKETAPLIRYGHHAESETVKAMNTDAGPLHRAYRATKVYFEANRRHE